MTVSPAARDRVAALVSFATFALHATLAGRYDVFRDELYFIVCGRHPQFGYVDQPPLVPLAAAALYGSGGLWAMRLLGALLAAATVWLTVRIVRELGGDDGAAATGAIAVAIAPMFMGLFSTLNTTVLEPAAWTALAYGLLRATRGDARALVWCGVVVGVALEAKYAVIAWAAALAIGLLATPGRRVLARRDVPAAVALACALAAPSLVWQAAHGWPFAELVHAARAKNADVAPPAFVFNQVLVFNPVLAPLWLAGLIAPFVRRDLARARFLAIAYVVVVATTIASHGKDYYVAGAYPTLFAIGATAAGRVLGDARVRVAYLSAAVAVSAALAPVALPVLAPEAVATYLARTHLAPQRQERDFAGTVLPQTFADQLGWRDFVREVAAAYAAVPASERARTAILVDNYGEAAALDVLGKPYGLPPALSGHNQYFLWRERGQQAANLLRVQDHVERLRPYCAQVRVLGTTFSRYAMAYENGKAIAFCRGLKTPLARLWPDLKNFS